MTFRILSDSETARISYPKEVDEFLENGLSAASIPQGSATLPHGLRHAATDLEETSASK